MPFLVGAVDPGITAMAMVVVDLETLRIVRATPLSPMEIAKQECRKGGATGITAVAKRRAVKPRGKRVSPNSLIAPREVPLVAAHLVRKQYPEYFMRAHGVQFVLIEDQIRDRLKELFLCMRAAMATLNVRHHVSSMRSIRAHYGTGVSAKQMDGRTAKIRDKRAYDQRKDLSIEVCDQIIAEGDLTLLRRIARSYWSKRPTKSNKEREDRVDKCYGDLVEATIHALYPGNWVPLLRKAYRGVEEAPDNMTEAKLYKAADEEFSDRLPRIILERYRAYYEEKRARLSQQRKAAKAAKQPAPPPPSAKKPAKPAKRPGKVPAMVHLPQVGVAASVGITC